MKRMFIVLLTVLMVAVCFCACGTSVKRVDYTIYQLGAKGESVEIDGKTVTYHNADALQFEFDVRVAEFSSKEAPERMTVHFGEKEVVFSYTKSTHTQFSNSKNAGLKKLGERNLYTVDEPNLSAQAEFDANTGNLVYYYQSVNNPAEGDFTVEDAKEQAAMFIHSLYGNDALDGYTLDVAQLGEMLGEKEIVINYRKYVSGYPTCEYIRVWFDLEGNITAFNATTYGVFKAVEEKISEHRIEDAEKELLSSLPEGASVQDDRKLLVDAASGICYLEVAADGKVYYINIT